jgi:hypothetical protein
LVCRTVSDSSDCLSASELGAFANDEIIIWRSSWVLAEIRGEIVASAFLFGICRDIEQLGILIGAKVVRRPGSKQQYCGAR